MLAFAEKYKKRGKAVRVDYLQVATAKASYNMLQQFQKYKICRGKYYIYVVNKIFCLVIEIKSLTKFQLHSFHVIPKDQYKFISWTSKKYKLNEDQFQFLFDSLEFEIHKNVIQEVRNCTRKIGGKFQEFVERVIKPEDPLEKKPAERVIKPEDPIPLEEKPVDSDEIVKKEAKFGSFECPDCSRKFKYKAPFLKHLKKHENNIDCEIWKAPFQNLEDLEGHEKDHQKEIEKKPTKFFFKCSECPFETKQNACFLKHKKKHLNAIECSMCAARFLEPKDLEKHENDHRKEIAKAKENVDKKKNKKVCPICNINCKDEESLAQHHQKIHENGQGKPFCCEICKKRYKVQESLDNHMKNHEKDADQDRPFTCDICNHRFTNKNNLRIHLSTHWTGRRFKCQICGKKFRNNYCLNHHRFKVHNNHKFYCPICKFHCQDVQKLKIHQIEHF